MSITDVSSFFDIDWKIVKECEKKYLRKKFRYIPLKDIKIIGVDELFVRGTGKRKIYHPCQRFRKWGCAACRGW